MPLWGASVFTGPPVARDDRVAGHRPSSAPYFPAVAQQVTCYYVMSNGVLR